MPNYIRCRCGHELSLSAAEHRVPDCPLCGRRPPAGAVVVARDIGKFATVLIALALLTAAPGIWVMGEALTRPVPDAVHSALPVWAYLVIFVAIVQVAYSVYLLQFPHWASLQAVAAVSLACGVASAVALGGALVGSAAGWAGTLLQLADLLPTARGPKLSGTALWCFAFTVGWTSFSIWCGWRAQLARRTVNSGSRA